jgi:hypothetical protein
MAEDGEENIYESANYRRQDEAMEDDEIIDDDQDNPDDEVEGEDLDENLEE